MPNKSAIGQIFRRDTGLQKILMTNDKDFFRTVKDTRNIY